MSNVCGNKVKLNRHARAEPAPAKAWGGHPGDFDFPGCPPPFEKGGQGGFSK